MLKETPQAVSAGPDDADLVFYLLVYRDTVAAHWCLNNIRRSYPKSRVIVVSDGDADSMWSVLTNHFRCEFLKGERLITPECGGRLVHRMCELFLKEPAPWLIRLDTDSWVRRRLCQSLPKEDIFGTIQKSGPHVSVQGGIMGISASCVSKLYQSNILLSDVLIDYAQSWAVNDTIITVARERGIVSDDWIIGYCGEQLGLTHGEWPEVKSLWQDSPRDAGDLYAITHSHKLRFA